MAFDIVRAIAEEFSLPIAGVQSVVGLLSEGATVPFIARYRKEATGGLDEVQIHAIEERSGYLRELEERKKTILEELEKQEKLTDSLRAQIAGATSKSTLEDLYLPFKPKRRTRAMIARERGLEPLAKRILSQPLDGSPASEAQRFVNPDNGVETADDALRGARDIVAETLAETASVRAYARGVFFDEGVLVVTRAPEVTEPTRFETYYDFREPCRTMPSHRVLAVRRGESENILRTNVEVDPAKALVEVSRLMGRVGASPWARELDQAVSDGWKRLLAPSVETELRVELKARADRDAVEIFAQNLRALLLAAPLGPRAVLGIDPGQRTGCKYAMVDASGKLVVHGVFYLVQGDAAVGRAKAELSGLIERYNPVAVAVGNGTHGRETESFVRETVGNASGAPFVVSVSEAGASVYSASDVAREEFPELDLTVRGAVSIARRLQDPLSELVKVDPKSIGVGQYQHDVFQPLLGKKLDEVVESCVNSVGVELNTASAPLLSRVAGIGPTLARRMVQHRERNGAFRSRKAVLEVAGLGPKTFEQCAGFLRVHGGEHPLDASAVHPERYALVERIAKDLGVELRALIADTSRLRTIEWKRYANDNDNVGELTLRDIASELEKPGRDPRARFEPPKFRDDVRTLEDLTPGMSLEGVVTNVTAFGAFVDVGVHQDGLVHVSQLSDRFVKDPAEVVRPGDTLKVRVIEVDLVRKRISLTARSGQLPNKPAPRQGPEPTHAPSPKPSRQAPQTSQSQQGDFKNNPFARLLKR